MRRVLIEVDEDALAALLLPPRVGDDVGMPARELASEGHGASSHLNRIPTRLQTQVHVNAVLSRRLRVADDAELAEKLPHETRDGAGVFEVGTGCGIEVDAELVRVLGVGREGRPHVEAETPEVDRPRDVREVGDHERA